MKRGRDHLNTKDRTAVGAYLRELVLLNLGVIVLGVLMLCFP